LPNVGQNGTDICLKLKVKIGKIWSKFGIKDGRSCSKLSYEMVGNFNNFKAFVMFAVKNWKPCPSWSKNVEYAYVSPENFF
jgi:hypothetical protein